ncbi:UNVERIFIED_CONTAM: hypothetical protein K2H54_022342 [Gekko kuhli]
MDEAAVPANEEQPPPPPLPLLPPPPPLSLQKALQQCELVQNMIDISISNLEGLRTKCATSNDLTQKEIRTLEYLPFQFLHPCARLHQKEEAKRGDPLSL